jgi:hypothetical protein
VIEGAPQELGASAGGQPVRIAYRDADGKLVELPTDDPTTVLHELTGAALARGQRLEGLTVTRPTLEDVYLELTAGEDDSERAPDPVAGRAARRGRGRRGPSRSKVGSNDG